MWAEWIIDEERHAGEEHLDPATVADYDEKIPFDPSRELDLLTEYGLSTSDVVVDFGTGTGVFALAVADYCDRVIALDVSGPMLQVVRDKVESAEVRNVEPVHSGIVSYVHDGQPASFAFSKNVLHHLPNFWKVEALKTVGETLETGGIFRLRDLVYSFDPWDSHEAVAAWLAAMEETAFSEAELYRHVREEFSTYGFLLESMLQATGFEILESTYSDGFYAAYTCRWLGEG